MICPKCKTEVSENANFCCKCGAKLREACNCWLKGTTYSCGQAQCPGYRLFLIERELQA